MGKESYNMIIFVMSFIFGVVVISTEVKGRGGFRDGDGIGVVSGSDEKGFNIVDFDVKVDGEIDN